MPLHVVRRRPSACRISMPCVLLQLGHQAANCTNGTINWKQIYGEEAFRLKAPLYESDFERLRKVKQVDFDDLGKRAREYAKVRLAPSGSVAKRFGRTGAHSHVLASHW